MDSQVSTAASRSGSGWKVLTAVVFGVFMVILDSTVVNVAFKTLQEEYAANLNLTQWVLSVYTMALGIATPLSGFLGDRFGEKRVFIASIFLFGLSSLLCGLAPSLGLLILFRALQGAAGGVATPLGTSLLYKAFPPEDRGAAMGVFGIALVAAPALGPILGGWLVDLGHWRWIFYINVPIALVGTLLGSLWLPSSTGSRTARFDPLGLLFSSAGLGSLLYAASQASDLGWTAPEVVRFFLIGAVALLIFALVELFVAREPLLDLRLFGNRAFLVAILTGWVSVLALCGAEFLMPLYLQVLRGRTALEAGVLLLPAGERVHVHLLRLAGGTGPGCHAARMAGPDPAAEQGYSRGRCHFLGAQPPSFRHIANFEGPAAGVSAAGPPFLPRRAGGTVFAIVAERGVMQR